MIVFVFMLGLAVGSFINALVWRLHGKRDFVKERSVCEHCGHTLAWYDLIPLVSWLSLRGRCRYCRKSISVKHPIVEATMACLFLAAYVYWPNELNSFTHWLLFGLFLALTAVLLGLLLYDLAWMILPDGLMLTLAILVASSVLVHLFTVDSPGGLLKDTAAGSFVGGGIFYILFQISGGKWIGGGDVKLGLVMGAYSGALSAGLALLIAFYSAALFILPGLISGKLSRKSKVPFGPFLIVGFYIVGVWGVSIAERVKDWLMIN